MLCLDPTNMEVFDCLFFDHAVTIQTFRSLHDVSATGKEDSEVR
jgi:hypothetical protein